MRKLLYLKLLNPAFERWECVSKFQLTHSLRLSDKRLKLHTVLLSMDFQSADLLELLPEPNSETKTGVRGFLGFPILLVRKDFVLHNAQ